MICVASREPLTRVLNMTSTTKYMLVAAWFEIDFVVTVLLLETSLLLVAMPGFLVAMPGARSYL